MALALDRRQAHRRSSDEQMSAMSDRIIDEALADARAKHEQLVNAARLYEVCEAAIEGQKHGRLRLWLRGLQP